MIVESGTGMSTANSYVSVADADLYVDMMMSSAFQTSWNALSTSDKETALIRATASIDMMFHSRYAGVRLSRLQALLWPRMGVVSDDGYLYPANEIPSQLKNVIVEAAVRVVQDDDLIIDVADPGAILQESVQVGPISVSNTYAGAKPDQKKYSIFAVMLEDLLGQTGTVERG